MHLPRGGTVNGSAMLPLQLFFARSTSIKLIVTQGTALDLEQFSAISISRGRLGEIWVTLPIPDAMFSFT